MLISKKSNKKIRSSKEKNVLILRHLAKAALDSKWIEDQSKNTNKILSPCEFCDYVKSNEIDCSECKIPKILCRDDGYKGLIGLIYVKYGNITLKNIGRDEYYLVRQSLMEIFKEGEISINPIQKIKDLINSEILSYRI